MKPNKNLTKAYEYLCKHGHLRRDATEKVAEAKRKEKAAPCILDISEPVLPASVARPSASENRSPLPALTPLQLRDLDILATMAAQGIKPRAPIQDNLKTRCIVVTGDIVAGFHFYGPFANKAQANAWGKEYCRDYVWSVTSLLNPLEVIT